MDIDNYIKVLLREGKYNKPRYYRYRSNITFYIS
jgi:hypothetical protein